MNRCKYSLRKSCQHSTLSIQPNAFHQTLRVSFMSALHSTALNLRTAVIGVGSLGRQHARIHAALAAEGQSSFVAVCDIDEKTARSVAEERGTKWTTDWRTPAGR